MNKDNFESDSKRTMPVCLSSKEVLLLEEYSKKKGMLNCSQALESLIRETGSRYPSRQLGVIKLSDPRQIPVRS
jgi:hypothetical protein